YTTPREYNSPMELHATVAAWGDDGSLTVWEPSQWAEGARGAFAAWFDLPPGKIRVVSPYVGGGFGAKISPHAHAALACLAARELRRPVKLAATRPQNFTAHGLRPATRQRVALGAGADGTLQALIHGNLNETSFEDSYVEPAGSLARIMYAVPNLTATQRLAQVNMLTPGWMRAPGEAVGAFALESAMDELAFALRMDPLELRLRNWAEVDPENGKPWSTRRLREAYEVGASAFGWHRRPPLPRSMRDGHQLIGWGMAGGAFPVFRSPAEARVSIQAADGTVEVATSGADIGTGTYTILAQTAAETLGMPVERIRVRLGDTLLPRAPVAGGSQLANLLTAAVQKAARAARVELLALAANHPSSPFRAKRINDFVVRDGIVVPADGSAAGVPVAELLRRIRRERIEVLRDTLPPEVASEEERRAAFETLRQLQDTTAIGEHAVYSWCAQFAEVRVDADYGTVRISRLVGAFDCGRIYNPKLAESQWIGGMIMGMGQALLEEVHVDRRNARITNSNLGDYLLPVNADVPDIRVIAVGEPDPHASALGGKSVGEIGIVGTAAAIANAVFHATGRRIRDLPITMEKLTR
ncbi:MAG TPA: xanthine dehydrogenase family protein molybdopterin-binding subunit, partial [Crenalkalicoccus sp.]|nr:xanthine dehydrogenase family protein molybdopterin-binding subunit [Crenalkalicoccus sp.]